MSALPKSFMRALLAALLLLTLFIQTDAYAQATRAVAPPTTDLRPPPPPPADPPYNNAAFSGQSVPTTMTAGQVYTVTVNMRNNGTTTWISDESYNLGSRNPYDNVTWGGGRVPLAGPVEPGQTAVFTFNVTAPATPGSYNFQWAMVQDGVEWFGPPSDNVVINVVAPVRVNNAVIVAQNVPAQMVSGQSYPVTMVMQNTGNTTWTTADQYSFGIPTTNGVQLWNGGRVPLPGAVGPGGQVTFNFNVTAPAPGSYSFFGLMVQDGVEFFGQGSSIPVSVSAPPANGAAFVSQSVPATMVPGQSYPVSVSMRNTGNTTWTASQFYRLGSSSPLDNRIWTTTRVELAGDVAPGGVATFNFQVTAPATPGAYSLEWHMLREWGEWFGAPSQAVSVSVATPPPPPDNVTYIHTDGLGSPVARSDSAGIIISRTSYEPYGRTAGGVTPTIGFTGHVNDADTGLVYMQQRYYDPVAGRFLSVDPVETDPNLGFSFNRYAYANNSPFHYRDPDGRAIESISVDKNKNVRIIIALQYRGAISPDQAASINTAIAQKWSGQFGAYNVHVSIVSGADAEYPNYVNIIPGVGRSEAAGNGARTAWLYTKELNGVSMADAMSHELGHLFGMSSYPFDKYYNGKAFPGWEGNIMADPKGKVEERNIIDLINFGRAYLGNKENISPGSTPSYGSPSNAGPQGCMAQGGDCWH